VNRSAISTPLLPALLLSGCLAAPVPAPRPADPSAPRVLEAMALVDRMPALSLWPGFDPRTVPVAVFDGRRTLLFRHPAPPPEFAPLEGFPGALTFAGRHSSVRANTSVDLNGVKTATVTLEGPSALRPERLAALVVHEAFHVFREARHPDWVGNEAELFLYPIEDPELLRARRLETEALRRALAAEERGAAACWAGVALGMRAERFAALSPGAAGYERGTELNEGLAQYVERRAAGGVAGEVLPAGGFAAAAVRERGYATGQALALLLDRFAPAWRDALERGDAASLDELLRASLDAVAASGCGFSGAEVRLAAERAAADVAEHRGALRARREDFLGAPGWRIEVEAGAEPLWPQGFDPLNVHRLSAGEVLHARWIRLGNAAGSIEVLNRSALTEAAGEHPLFNGVRRVVVAGLSAAPLVRDSAGVAMVQAEGVEVRLAGSARLDEGARTLRIVAR
jgi:hypothetical protein